MSTEEGNIIKVVGNKAFVTVNRSGMCDSCQSKGACNSLGGGSQNMEAEALNTANGIVGDRVKIQIPSSSLIKMTFLVYLLPCLTLIAGAIFGMNYGEKHNYDPDMTSILFATISFIITFLIIKLISNRFKDDKKYMPEIIKVVAHDATPYHDSCGIE